MVETHEHAGDFREPSVRFSIRASWLVLYVADWLELFRKATAFAPGLTALGEQCGNRSVAASNFERPGTRPNDIEQLDMPTMHRIAQFRHQCEALPLAFQVMT
jgi:hypothetical protein